MLHKYIHRVLLSFVVYFIFHANRSLGLRGIFEFVLIDLVYFVYITFIVLVILELVDWLLLHIKRIKIDLTQTWGNWKAAILLSIATLPIVIGASLFSYFFIHPIVPCDHCPDQNIADLGRDMMLGQILAILIIAARLIRENAREVKNLERDRAIMQKELYEAQYHNLKNQVNPHFLFNSFSSLQYLIETNPEKAAHFLDKLSDFYRNMLEKDPGNMNSVERELEILDNYLYLLKSRHQESIQIKLEIPENCLQKFIPSMSLQMLVENAVKHNLFSEKSPLQIDIFVDEEQLVVQNKIKKRPDTIQSTRIGLENIRRRYYYQDPWQGALANLIVCEDEKFTVKLPIMEKA